MDYIKNKEFSLIIVPDAGSNDYSYHKQLKQDFITTIVLDHHEAEKISEDAIIINNQLSNYPNKSFSGAGIVYQFCRYLDNLLNKNNADNYLDLAALGNLADVMDLRSFETKHIILKGFKRENIKNPFIYGMAEKNSYSLGNKITPMGAAFYIAPFINSMVRSGTLEEKKLLFDSMLKYKAFTVIPSTKRGCKGQTEQLVDQAIRTAINVKNRQTRAQESAMEELEELIENRKLLEHKVLLFLLEPGQIDKNIAGLVANKLMAKYQRPVCVLTKTEIVDNTLLLTSYPPQDYKIISYQGSARGCDKIDIKSFKEVCENTQVISYAEGHANAFGLGIPAPFIKVFITQTDKILENMSDEPIYYVDYIYQGNNIESQHILDIASLEELWGQGISESLIAIENLKITKDMVTVYVKKNNTLKITLPNKVTIMLFDAADDLCDKLQNHNEGYIEFNIIGKCNINEWNGNVTPQIFIEDFEIIGESKYIF